MEECGYAGGVWVRKGAGAGAERKRRGNIARRRVEWWREQMGDVGGRQYLRDWAGMRRSGCV